MSLAARLVATFGGLSLVSIGGANAMLPEIHRQVVTLHQWMSEATFARITAIGQTAPGPNVLVVSMVGWQLAGLLGLVAVTAAFVAPSSIMALLVGRALARREEAPTIVLVKAALAPIALGFMLASALVMTRAAWQGWGTAVLAAAVASTMVFTRLSPLVGILCGAIVGIAVHRLTGAWGGLGS